MFGVKIGLFTQFCFFWLSFGHFKKNYLCGLLSCFASSILYVKMLYEFFWGVDDIFCIWEREKRK